MVTEVCVRVLKCDPCVCVSKVQYVSLLSSSYQKNEVPRSALKVTVSWKNSGQIKQPVRSEVRAVLSASGTLPRPLLFCRAMKRWQRRAFLSSLSFRSQSADNSCHVRWKKQEYTPAVRLVKRCPLGKIHKIHVDNNDANRFSSSRMFSYFFVKILG